jgi:hypothetical protein
VKIEIRLEKDEKINALRLFFPAPQKPRRWGGSPGEIKQKRPEQKVAPAKG